MRRLRPTSERRKQLVADVDRTVSRAALLELRRDREVFEQGHRFLDEKRMLLAQEILRRLAAHETLQAQFETLEQEAVAALKAAIDRHGVDGLALYPPIPLQAGLANADASSFLGVPLMTGNLLPIEPEGAPRAAAPFPSAEAEACAQAYRALLRHAGALAASVTNLQRLAADYTRTERRTLALEDILLPEMRSAERDIDSRLEEAERDEVMRVRWFGR